MSNVQKGGKGGKGGQKGSSRVETPPRSRGGKKIPKNEGQASRTPSPQTLGGWYPQYECLTCKGLGLAFMHGYWDCPNWMKRRPDLPKSKAKGPECWTCQKLGKPFQHNHRECPEWIKKSKHGRKSQAASSTQQPEQPPRPPPKGTSTNPENSKKPL